MHLSPNLLFLAPFSGVYLGWGVNIQDWGNFVGVGSIVFRVVGQLFLEGEGDGLMIGGAQRKNVQISDFHRWASLMVSMHRKV